VKTYVAYNAHGDLIATADNEHDIIELVEYYGYCLDEVFIGVTTP